MSQQPSGWYDDPSTPDQLRYWDGVTWTNHTAPKKSPTASQSTIGLPQAVPPAQQAASPPAQVPPPSAPGANPYGPPAQQPTGQHWQAPANASWMTAVKTTADGVPLASWGRRFGAWLIDGVILVVLTVIIYGALAPELWAEFGRVMDVASTGDQVATERATQDFTEMAQGASLKLGLASFLLVFGYCVAFWTTLGQTLGKMAVGISVRRADRPGPLDLSTAVRRRLLSLLQVVPLVGGLYLIVWLLDGLWPLWDSRQQALHDKIADTQVVMGKQPRKGA